MQRPTWSAAGRRSLHLASHELELHLAHIDDVARVQVDFRNGVAIDQRAVRRVEVAQHKPAALALDHGLLALWDSNSPNLQKMANQGVLGYSRADIPTHSNQSNMTLLSGAWPEVTDVPHNSWLDRSKAYAQPFELFSLSQGSYIYYDLNPLGKRVDSIYTAAHAGRARGGPPFPEPTMWNVIMPFRSVKPRIA